MRDYGMVEAITAYNLPTAPPFFWRMAGVRCEPKHFCLDYGAYCCVVVNAEPTADKCADHPRTFLREGGRCYRRHMLAWAKFRRMVTGYDINHLRPYVGGPAIVVGGIGV
jgi:hypothetical protein